MSFPGSVDDAQVTAIAAEVFAALVDGQTGFLTSWPGASAPALANPLHAWVDLGTEPASRVQVTTDASTAGDLTRALLHIDSGEPVAEADVVDALGEIANICSGNIKAMLPTHVGLALPEVSRQPPASAGAAPLHEVVLAWRGHPLVISLGTI